MSVLPDRASAVQSAAFAAPRGGLSAMQVFFGFVDALCVYSLIRCIAVRENESK